MTSSPAETTQALPSLPGREGWGVATTWLALLCLVLTGMRFDLSFGLTAGLALALVLLPLWVPWVRSSRWITWIVVLAGVSAASSVWLTLWHSDTRDMSTAGLLESVFGVLGCYLTARLAPTRPMTHSITLGGIGFVIGVIGAVVTWGTWTSWYSLAIIALTLPSAWLGGRLAQRRL